MIITFALNAIILKFRLGPAFSHGLCHLILILHYEEEDWQGRLFIDQICGN